MKNTKRLAALGLSLAMMLTTVCGVSFPENVQAASKSVMVSNQKQLDKALKAKGATKITIKTSAKKTLKIKSGSYTQKQLVIKGAKLTVSNSGKFKNVTIEDAATFKELAKKNSIKINDKKLNLVIGKKATVKSITLTKKDAVVKVTNQSSKSVKIKKADGTFATIKAGKTKTIKKETVSDNDVVADKDETNDKNPTPGKNPGYGYTGFVGGGSSGSSSGSVSVSSVAEFVASLNSNAETITFATEEPMSIEIPNGNYSNKDLIIDAPKATITNNGTFKSVTIKQIAANTWIERATGNTLDIVAANAHVVLQGSAKVNLDNPSASVNVDVQNPVSVQISGSAANVKVNATAEGATIATSVPVTLNASAVVIFEVKAGAEASKIEVVNDSVMPVVLAATAITIPVTNVTSGKSTNITASQEAPQGVVSGNVVFSKQDGTEGVVNGAAVYAFPLSDYEADPAKAMENPTSQYATNTNAEGVYTLSGLPYGRYVIVAKADGLNSAFRTCALVDGVACVDFTLVDGQGTGSVYGIVKNAGTGEPVGAGIDVYVRQGGNNTVGTPVATMKTNAEGAYRFENLQPGEYTVEFSDNRGLENSQYAHASFDIIIYNGVDAQRDVIILDRNDDDEVRFVLTWGRQAEDGSVPSDLDSHLIGPSEVSGKFHVYFSDKEYEVGDVLVSRLDVDDTSYEGPETTSVYKVNTAGEYHFYVYDYSNQDDKENTRLSSSQAVVEVYIKGVKVKTYSVPKNKVGTLWDVCSYNPVTGAISDIDEVYFHPGSSSDVGLSKEELAKDVLQNHIDDAEKILANLLDRANGKYTVSGNSATNFTSSLTEKKDAAKAVINNPASTIEQIQEADDALISAQNAILDFVKIESIGSKDVEIEDSNITWKDDYSERTVYFIWTNKNVSITKDNIKKAFDIKVAEGATLEIKGTERNDMFDIVVYNEKTGLVQIAFLYVDSEEY